MHEVTRAMFSLLPSRLSIKRIFGETLSSEESVEIDLDIDDPRAAALNNAIRKRLKRTPGHTTIFMRSDENVFMTVYTKTRKYYIEFYEGLNSPVVEDD